MKKIILLQLFVLAINNMIVAQTFYAQYKVNKTETIPGGEHGPAQNILLDYIGKYFQKGQMCISYLVPQYLSKYPEGRITKESSGNQFVVYPLKTDSIQSLDYKNFDSLIWRTKTDMSGGAKGDAYYYTFEPGFRKWVMLSDTKIINGLKCQRAQYLLSNGQLIWDVWFCAEIPVLSGFGSIFDLPWLMVEGYLTTLNTTFMLKSYEANISINESTFFPSSITPSKYKKNHLRKLNN